MSFDPAGDSTCRHTSFDLHLSLISAALIRTDLERHLHPLGMDEPGFQSCKVLA